MFGKLNRSARNEARGFSLVELLVVIGIISLLIGIALPAFSRAKEQAKITTSTATINTIGTGLDMFRADTRLGGEYPPSIRARIFNPHVDTNVTTTVNGASLAMYALAGADLLGSAGIRDANGTDAVGVWNKGRAPWSDDLNRLTNGLYRLNGTQPFVARTSFIDPSKMKFPKQVSNNPPTFEIPAGKGKLSSPVFLDSFDQPILYYRAAAGRPVPFADEPIGNGVLNGVYNLDDNAEITGGSAKGVAPMDLGAGTKHFANPNNSSRLGDWQKMGMNMTSRPDYKGSFGYTIQNPNVIATVAPHNAETYILLSAGPDGLFGTEDDIANFPTNK